MTAPAQDARAILAASASSIGRFQAPELFYQQTVNLAAPQTISVPRPLNLNRPAESLTISLRFRVTVTVAPYVAVAPEAPQTMLQLLLLNGTHRQYGNQTPIRMTGATLYAWQQLFQSNGGDILVNGVRANVLARPIVSPFTGLVGAHDVLIMYTVPFGPQMGIGQSTKRDLASYLYQPADWGDTLNLQVNLGDATALGDNTGATTAFTAFGSAAGLPSMAIHVNYSILGPFANRLKTGLIIRNEQELIGQFTNIGNNLRMQQLAKAITTNVLVKSGTTQAVATAGVAVYDTLSDTQLDATQIVVDNKPIKNNQDNLVMKNYVGRMFNTIIPGGYLLLTFVDGQNPQLAYRGDGVGGGALFEVYSNVLTAAATQRQSITQEQILGGPFVGPRSE